VIFVLLMAQVVVWTSGDVKLKSTVYVSIIASAACTLVYASGRVAEVVVRIVSDEVGNTVVVVHIE
jgi:hypothetical protein